MGIFNDNPSEQPKPTLPKLTRTDEIYLAQYSTPAGIAIDDSKLVEEYTPLKVEPAAPVSDPPANMQMPDVPFIQCYNFIQTIPKLSNSILAEIDNIIGRDWHFAPVEGDDKEKKTPEDKTTEQQEEDPVAKEYVNLLNKWEVDFELERLFEYIITDWSACGNNLLGISDWQPVQLSRIWGLERDLKTGKITRYWFIGAQGERIPLDPEKFIHSRYWDMGREPWGLGKFHSLFTNNFTDPDVKKPKPLAAIFRVMVQDSGKIHHKFAMPRIIYGFKDVNKEVFEQDIKPIFQQVAQGGRAAFNKEFTMQQESVDGTARFTESIDLLADEVEAGSGSSVNRVQTKASALADARVADSGTDDRYLGDMDRIRRLMNNEIIPRVIAQSKNDLKNWKNYRGIIEFRWGLKDNFRYDPSELHQWVVDGVMAIKEVRETIKASGKTLHDDWFEQEKQQEKKDQTDLLRQKVALSSGAKGGSNFTPSEDKGEESLQSVKKTAEEALKKIDEWAAKNLNNNVMINHDVSYANLDEASKLKLSQYVKATEYNERHDPKTGEFTFSEFTEAEEKHEAFLKVHPELTKPEAGYTFDPRGNRHFDAFDVKHRQDLLNQFTQGKQDLYIIANTNNDISPASYSEAKKLGNGHVFIGGWTDKSGKRFVDTSFPVAGITDAEAIALKNKYKQQSVLKISSDATKDPVFLE